MTTLIRDDDAAGDASFLKFGDRLLCHPVREPVIVVAVDHKRGGTIVALQDLPVRTAFSDFLYWR